MEYRISRRVVVSWIALTGLLFALVIVRSPGVGAQAAGPGLEVVRVRDWTPVPPGDVEAAEATCPVGMKIIGGGFSAIGADATMQVAIALPVDGATTWRVVAENPGHVGNGRVIARGICAVVTTPSPATSPPPS